MSSKLESIRYQTYFMAVFLMHRIYQRAEYKYGFLHLKSLNSAEHGYRLREDLKFASVNNAFNREGVWVEEGDISNITLSQLS